MKYKLETEYCVCGTRYSSVVGAWWRVLLAEKKKRVNMVVLVVQGCVFVIVFVWGGVGENTAFRG